ncbi:MAG: rhomboid family intramembrane serine protease [Deltaproteobacteria bacterium]|nr:rhomboid family intramembrane serine protease [Deltaproteobacteria bacterium]
MLGKPTYVDPNAKMLRLGGRPPRTTLTLLILQLSLFVLMAFIPLPRWIPEHLVLSANGLFSGKEIWQPLTALVLHLGLRSTFFDMATLWIFGAALERWWGGKRFLKFYLVTGVVGLLVGATVGLASPLTPLFGSDGAAMAMIIATAVIFPRHLVHLHRLTALKVGLSCLILGAVTLVGTMLSAAWLQVAVLIGGGLTAAVFLGPRRTLGELLAKRAQRIRREKSNLELIDGGKKDDSGKKDEPRYWN